MAIQAGFYQRWRSSPGRSLSICVFRVFVPSQVITYTKMQGRSGCYGCFLDPSYPTARRLQASSRFGRPTDPATQTSLAACFSPRELQAPNKLARAFLLPSSRPKACLERKDSSRRRKSGRHRWLRTVGADRPLSPLDFFPASPKERKPPPRLSKALHDPLHDPCLRRR